MALASRRRRGRRPRWVLLGLVATVVVLLVNAAFSSPNNPSRRLAQLAYLDRVRPQIDRSTSQGASIAQVRADAVTLGRQGVTPRMARVVRDADAVLSALRRVKPPDELVTAHNILVATVAVRARVASSVSAGLDTVFTDGPVEPGVDELVQAGEEMVASDRIYKTFVDGLPALAGVAQPLLADSTWAADAQLWSRPELAAFAASVRAKNTLTPVHDLSVLRVSTDPAAVATEGNASVLPMVRSLRLDIVVANTGNAPERQVPVVATLIGPAGEVDTARDFVDLAPGQRRSVPLGGLRPVPGGPSTLTVMIGPVAGESSIPDNERSVGLVLRG